MTAYASWSVVFGEQPSAAKWNILGTNDAAFNNGTGLPLAGLSVQSVATSQTRTSSTYGDLATTGPTVTVTIGTTGNALICMSAEMFNSTTDYCLVGLVVSGANTIAVKQYIVSQGTNDQQQGTTFVLSTLTPGSTTFKMQYANINNSSTATFLNRQLSVVPL